LTRRSHNRRRSASLLFAALIVASCQNDDARTDADVVVVGAGIAGISAALEASSAGASVIVIERSSVAGGHAVQAGGFALVDTPLQRAKGHADSPDLAFGDLMAWGEDANAAWVRAFVERSRNDIHDWLAAFGVRFSILLDTPEDSVPRFHFAGGTAVNVIVPMLREAVQRDNIRWALNSRVDDLHRDKAGTFAVRFENERSGAVQIVESAAVVLATGGFQGDLDVVRRHWPDGIEEPERILLGAGHFAVGDGIGLGESVGASVTRLESQVTFVRGMPNPRDPSRGLLVMNPASMWLDASGRRFVDEAANDKVKKAAVLALDEQSFWMLFDARGLKRLRIRGAEWLNRDTLVSEVLDNPAAFVKTDTPADLANAAGLPPPAVAESAAAFAAAGGSFDEPPYYAVRLWPMTRKSMGGVAIDTEARALSAGGTPIAGLFAAGELTGVAGINGSHGGSGTFLAPSVLTGRIAGNGAARHAAQARVDATGFDTATTADSAPPLFVTDAESLARVISRERAGYWHFEASHRVVLSRAYDCARCHKAEWPVGPAHSVQQRILQLDSCTTCH
jgi:succinate dehydrogenase/fumarate reductase flavoprotein subunit